MLKAFLVAAIALNALIPFVWGQSPLNETEEESALDENSALRLMEQANDVYWEFATAYRKFADDTLSSEILMREKMRPFYPTLQKYDWQNFTDPLLRRQFQVILRGVKYPPMEYKFKRATQTLKTMSRKKWACDWRQPAKCNLAFVHQIKSILTNSDDLEEVKYYWQEWRNKMTPDVKQALHYYISYYQGLRSPNEAPSAVWYDQYEDPHFIDELEELMTAIRPFYREMHAHVRNVLFVKYGEEVVLPTGRIPHHLLEQVTYQAWKKDSVLRNPFPDHKLPNLQAEIEGHGQIALDLANLSAKYMNMLGFNFTDDFMREHFIKMPIGSGGPDCKSRIFDYGEIELHYCPKVAFKKLLQTHGDMAKVTYAMTKNNMRVGLNQEACPGYGNALGEALILSVSNPKHLQGCLGFLKDFEYDDMLNLNRLYRLAVHTILTLPTYFVHEKLWTDIIDGKITSDEYNCHYWHLMQKYMGVEAPVQTNADAYDMPYKFYEGIVDQYRSTKKLFGEFLGYQIYRAICLSIGEFQRGNAYKVLDNCDFDHSPNAGALLQEMMAAGSTIPWRDTIKPLTMRHLSRLSATAFLEYFEPLHQWIIEDNQGKNLTVGWMTTDKCRESLNNTDSTTDFTKPPSDAAADAAAAASVTTKSAPIEA